MPTGDSFEGEITLSESSGVLGSLFESHTSFLILKNRIKREQRLGGLNTPFNIYAGMIVDLEKDSIVLYYANPATKKKHSLSIKEYQAHLKEKDFAHEIPSPIDLTFVSLNRYNRSKAIKDSLVIQGFQSDYSLFREKYEQQEIFDTKDLKIKRELLELVFMHLPEYIHFPLRSELKMMLSGSSNDSLINNKTTRQFESLFKKLLRDDDSEPGDSDLKDISNNKLVNWGVNALKKGVDMSFYISTKPSEVSSRTLSGADVQLPPGHFEEVGDFAFFFYSMSSGGSGFDD